jgi:hypothetical protein
MYKENYDYSIRENVIAELTEIDEHLESGERDFYFNRMAAANTKNIKSSPELILGRKYSVKTTYRYRKSILYQMLGGVDKIVEKTVVIEDA